MKNVQNSGKITKARAVAKKNEFESLCFSWMRHSTLGG